MTTFFSTLYMQPIVILGSNASLYGGGFTSSGGFGSSFYGGVYEPYLNTTDLGLIHFTESKVLATSFSSMPVISRTELRQDYQELGQALDEMIQLADEDEWKVEAPVYEAARYVATELMVIGAPAPYIFTHGPQSIVFNWTNDADNLYLTISADRLSVLISSPERIKHRISYSIRDYDSRVALTYIQAELFEQPTVLIAKGTSDSSASLD